MRIMPVAKALVGNIVEIAVAVLEELGDVLAIVFAGIKQTGNGGCRDRGTPAAPLGTVLYAAIGHGAFADVVDCFVDDLAGYGYSGIAASTQTLHLGDGG